MRERLYTGGVPWVCWVAIGVLLVGGYIMAFALAHAAGAGSRQAEREHRRRRQRREE